MKKPKKLCVSLLGSETNCSLVFPKDEKNIKYSIIININIMKITGFKTKLFK